MTNQKSIAKIIFSIVVVFSLSIITAEPLRAGTIDQNVDDPLTVFGHGSVDLLDGITQQPNNDNTNLAWNFGSVATHFTSLGPIDIVLPVDNSGGTTEYLISDLVKNETSYMWKGFQFQLGFGSGDSFVASNTSDLLDFDLPHKDPLPYADLHAISQYKDSLLEFQGGGGSAVPTNSNALFHFSFDIPDSNSQMPDVSQTSDGYTFTVRQEPLPKNYYALLIGMDYGTATENWSQDAVKLEAGLERFVGWNNADYAILSGQNINVSDVENAIHDIEQKIDVGDEFLFYYSGHGTDKLDIGNALPLEPPVRLSYEVGGLAFNYNSYLDEAILLSNGYLYDDSLENIFNNPTWNSIEKTFIFDTCLSGGFWGSLDPSFSEQDWDTGDLSNLQDVRFLSAASENELTSGIGNYLNNYLNSHSGFLYYGDWFAYVASKAPDHQVNVPIKSDFDYQALYSFDSNPVFLSNIPSDQEWANPTVPEPTTLLLLSLGFSMMGILRKSIKKQA